MYIYICIYIYIYICVCAHAHHTHTWAKGKLQHNHLDSQQTHIDKPHHPCTRMTNIFLHNVRSLISFFFVFPCTLVTRHDSCQIHMMKETIFCKRALKKRRYSAKETNNFKEPTNRSHPIP